MSGKRKIQVVNCDTGEIEIVRETLADNYSIQTVGDTGDIYCFGRIDNANFGEKHVIKNHAYTEIARQLTRRFNELEHIDVDNILFIENTHWIPPAAGESRKKTWIARIKKADQYLDRIWKYDYVMEVKGFYTDRMSKEQIIALIYHELRHIGTDGDIYPHDVEDWGNMVATLGANWAEMHKEIANLLDDDFPGWNQVSIAGKQMYLLRGGAVSEASKTE